MVLRLDLDNAADRKFLQKKIGKDALSHLRSSTSKTSNGSIASEGQDLQSNDRSSSIDNLEPTKRSKYGNKQVWCNTLQRKIDSIWEHDLYHMLANLEKKGKIKDLKHQSHHDLIVEGNKICRLELDFEFNWLNKKIYMDAKSEATSPSGFKMKVKLFTALFGEPVYLVERKKLGLFNEIAYGIKENDDASRNRRNRVKR